MGKPTITKTWLAGLIAIASGLILGGVSLGLVLAFGGHFTPAPGGNGYDFVPTLDGFFWTMVGLMIVGFIIAVVGGIVQLVAWIGALINTYRLEDKTWFIVLLAGGLLGLGFTLVGFAVMVAYLIAGPDGMALPQPRTRLSPAQPAMPPEPPPTPPAQPRELAPSS
jgi:hypothetical protein